MLIHEMGTSISTYKFDTEGYIKQSEERKQKTLHGLQDDLSGNQLRRNDTLSEANLSTAILNTVKSISLVKDKFSWISLVDRINIFKCL